VGPQTTTVFRRGETAVEVGTIEVPAMEEVKPGTITTITVTVEVEIIMLHAQPITTTTREKLGVATPADTLKNGSITITIITVGLSSTTAIAAIALIVEVGFLMDGQIITIILIIAMSGRATIMEEELSSREMRMVKMWRADGSSSAIWPMRRNGSI